MYDFELKKDENIIEVFEDILICQENNEKKTTVALTNKRLLFLDYNQHDFREVLRIGRSIEYIRYKEVYYQIHLEEIVSIEEKENYIVHLSNNINFEFDNDNLFKLLLEQLN